MVKGRKGCNGESDPEAEERKRLKQLAISNNLLSETPAEKFTPLGPSKTILKHHGKDIIKKSQRKNRYLFSFPGHLAPMAGGKIGELSHLGTKNPILYMEFPQGLMKLCGTIVYPKNRYLSLQFSKGGKNVICEDSFDNMIIFSEAYWIGEADKNPDEARLETPKELMEVQHPEYSFHGGAGVTAVKDQAFNDMECAEQDSPIIGKDDFTDKKDGLKCTMDVTPVRHSERASGKSFNYAEVSSEDDATGNGTEMSEEEEDPGKTKLPFTLDEDPTSPKPAAKSRNNEDIEPRDRLTPKQNPQSIGAGSTSIVKSHAGHGSLVQATISTLFKKVEEKNVTQSTRKSSQKKVGDEKSQSMSLKGKTKHVKAEKMTGKEKGSSSKKSGTGRTRKTQIEVSDDDIEELSSASEEPNGSDEEWTV